MGKLYIGNSVGVVGVPVEVPKEKMGVTVDTFLGDVVDGVLKKSNTSSKRYEIDGSGITVIDDSALDHAFYKNTTITSVSFPDLEEIKANGMKYAFHDASNITTINFDKLKKIDSYGLEYSFLNIQAQSISFPNLEEVGSYAFSYCFSNLENVTINFEKLNRIGTQAFSNALSNSKNINIYFSNLKHEYLIESESQFTGIFSYASNSIIHFPTNLEFVLGEWTYFKKTIVGSTNKAVFDLPNVEEFPIINIVASPDVLIEVNGKRTNVVSAPINTQLLIRAEKEGYNGLTLTHIISESCDIQLTDNMFIPIPSEYNINYNNMNDNLVLLSPLVDGLNFIISDELCGIVNGSNSFKKINGYSYGNLTICPTSNCILSITCEVSSESNYDYGAIYVGDSSYTPSNTEVRNGKVPENIIKLFSGSGIIAPQTYTTQLNAHQTYVISFVYTKDSSGDYNKDRMIITEIKTEPIPVEDN